MPVERDAEVVAVVGDRIQLRLAPACRECACDGRCDLTAVTGAQALSLELHRAQFRTAPKPGDAVSLQFHSEALLSEAWRGYGRPTAGLLLGSAVGAALAAGLALNLNVTALVGAIVGTFLGLGVSKRSAAVVAGLQVVPRP